MYYSPRIVMTEKAEQQCSLKKKFSAHKMIMRFYSLTRSLF